MKLPCHCIPYHLAPSSSGAQRMEPDGATTLAGRKVALIATGAFNPPHYAHLRIFERARDYLERVESAHVVVGYMSTVSDSSGILELAPAKHRLRMIEIALKKNEWIKPGSWEAQQSRQPSLHEILRHYEKEVRNNHGDETLLILLCGGDFLEAQVSCEPYQLANEGVESAVEHYRLIVVSRPGFEPAKSVYLVDGLRRNEANIHIIDDETFPNGLSSTRIRTAIRRGENVRYSLPDKVLSYIAHHRLYQTSSLQRRSHLREVEASCDLPPVPPRPSLHTQQLPQISHPPIPPPPKRSTSVKPTTTPLVPPRMSQSMHCNLSTPIMHQVVPSNSAGDVWESTYIQSQESTGSSESPKQSGRSTASKTTPEHRMTQSMTDHASPSSSTTKYSPKLTVGGAINVIRCEIPPKSPDYDNVTIDELLEASNCWAHYMNDQYTQIKNSHRLPNDRVIKEEKTSSCSPTKGPKKLFKPFMRSNSKTNNRSTKAEEKCNCAELYEQDFYGYREMMRERKCDCGSYLGPGEDDPRLMAVHANRPIRSGENGAATATQRSILSGAEGADRKSSREVRSIRFATNMTKSMDSIPSMKVNGGNGDAMSRSTNPNGGFATDDNQVTLSFTRYRLSATPETTV
ncbi:hypothetical protein PRIPAC_96025 [Pristionchus pacificus]|nr:hypothetical protein PRIPAC_96025 [Pristionchus pacificus]